MGSAFSQELDSAVGAEHIAQARALAGASYTADKFRHQSTPASASDSLVRWAERLGVTIRPSDTEATIRNACAAKYLASSGPTEGAIRDALEALLGSAYVNIVFHYGDDPTLLSEEPDNTFWTGVYGDGYVGPELNGDSVITEPAWSSDAAFLTVVVSQPSTMTLSTFLQLLTVQLVELMDRLLPAYTAWEWALDSIDDGFILGESLLGLDTL